MDDPIFLWTAQHVLGLDGTGREVAYMGHPRASEAPLAPRWLGFSLDFYGFEVNWYRTVQPMWEVNQNPPLVAYYLALWGRFLGFSEIAMHIAMLVPTLWCVWGIFCLARRFTTQPIAATLCATLNPLFLVSASTLMCDVPMLAFYVWSIELWARGLESGRLPYYGCSALCVGMGLLTKYFAITAIPLLLCWTLLRLYKEQRASERVPSEGSAPRVAIEAKVTGRARVLLPLLFLLLPLAILFAYEAWCVHLYGRGLFFDAIRYAADLREADDPRWVGRSISVLTFLGAGCVAAVSLNFSRLARWQWFAAGILGGAAAALVYGSDAGPAWVVSVQVFFWAVVGVLALFAAFGGFFHALKHGAHRGSHAAEALPLVLLLAGTLVFALAFNHFVNARILLAGIMAVCLLAFVATPCSAPGMRNATLCLALMPTVALSLLVLAADTAQAAGARALGTVLQTMQEAGQGPVADGESRVWFTGHWGLQYYLQQRGGRPLDVAKLEVKPGDLIVTPSNNTNLIQLKIPGNHVPEVFAPHTLRFLATQNKAAGAGFYADVFGPLPFAFGDIPPERYVLLRVP